MAELRNLLALAGRPAEGEASPLLTLLPMVAVFAIFYFILILPMKNKQKKLDQVVKALKAGDKVIINPGIFAVVVAVEDDAITVRVDEKTRIKVLKSAVASLQPAEADKEKKS